MVSYFYRKATVVLFRSVYVCRSKGLNALENLPSLFHVGCTIPKISTRRKGKTNQAGGIRKTTVNAKGKHVETREEAAAYSAQDLRENVLSQMQAFG